MTIRCFTIRRSTGPPIPNNLGHIDSPGCFRCHDGKHLDANQQAIRLECNLCHSIPVVAGTAGFRNQYRDQPRPGAGITPQSELDQPAQQGHRHILCGLPHNGRRGRHQQHLVLLQQRLPRKCVHLCGLRCAQIAGDPAGPDPRAGPTPTAGPPVENPTYDANVGACCLRQPARHATTRQRWPAAWTSRRSRRLMLGGKDGEVIVPGDPEGSLLVSVQSGQHFANLSTG